MRKSEHPSAVSTASTCATSFIINIIAIFIINIIAIFIINIIAIFIIAAKSTAATAR